MVSCYVCTFYGRHLLFQACCCTDCMNLWIIQTIYNLGSITFCPNMKIYNGNYRYLFQMLDPVEQSAQYFRLSSPQDLSFVCLSDLFCFGLKTIAQKVYRKTNITYTMIFDLNIIRHLFWILVNPLFLQEKSVFLLIICFFLAVIDNQHHKP